MHKSAQHEWIFGAPFQLFHFHGFGWLANRYTWSPFMKFSVVVTKMSLIICYCQNAALFFSDAHSYSPTRLTRLACCATSWVPMIWVHMITCVRTIHCRSWQVLVFFRNGGHELWFIGASVKTPTCHAGAHCQSSTSNKVESREPAPDSVISKSHELNLGGIPADIGDRS